MSWWLCGPEHAVATFLLASTSSRVVQEIAFQRASLTPWFKNTATIFLVSFTTRHCAFLRATLRYTATRIVIRERGGARTRVMRT